MHFDHAQRGPRLVDHGVHCAVETHLVGEQAFDLQAGIVDRLPVHLRGEVLAGLAQSAQRTGHAEESAQLVDKMVALMANTPYESMAKKWKANPQVAANTSLMCMNCHDAGRLSARSAYLSNSK